MTLSDGSSHIVIESPVKIRLNVVKISVTIFSTGEIIRWMYDVPTASIFLWQFLDDAEMLSLVMMQEQACLQPESMHRQADLLKLRVEVESL